MAVEKLQLPEGVPPLVSYYVYLTGGCNLACRHCWISPTFQRNGGTGGHLDYQLFELAIEEGLPLGLSNVKLTGGEPLLHPDFTRIVDLLKEKNLGLTIETNGTLLTESLAHYLKEKSTLNFISVSLDGANPETHDTFRGVKGSFEKTCQGIRYLANLGFRPQVIMSIHAGNVSEIDALVHLAENLGVASIKFNVIQPSGRGELMTERGQVLDIWQLVDLGKQIEENLQKQTSLLLHYDWPMAFRSLRRLLKTSSDACGIFRILGILSTGHLAMCGVGTQVPELCYGLLGEDPISEVWFSNPMLVELRKGLPASLDGICGKCIFRDQCLGSCVASNYHLAGSVSAPFWFCQAAEDAKIFPSSRCQ
jgi:SynChlorMet cassette radical SAM/SPASM protein ScmF